MRARNKNVNIENGSKRSLRSVLDGFDNCVRLELFECYVRNYLKNKIFKKKFLGICLQRDSIGKI